MLHIRRVYINEFTVGGFHLENNLFQQAKKALTNLTNMQGSASKDDQDAARSAIDAAYQDASPDELQQLQELELQLKQKNQLS